MKKLLLVLIGIFVCVNAYGAVVNTSITSNTAVFNTTGRVVTFDTVIRNLRIENKDNNDSVFVTFTGIGWSQYQKREYILPTVEPAYTSQSTVELKPSASIEVELSINKFGYVSDGVGSEGTIMWTATSDL